MSISYSHSLRYRPGWGVNVIQEFTEKYSRGTNFLVKMSGVSREECYRYMVFCICSGNQTRWESIKYIIKALNADEWADYKGLPEETRKHLLRYLKYVGENESLWEKSD